MTEPWLHFSGHDFSAMDVAALVAGAVFFIADIVVLGLIFKRLFQMVKESRGEAGSAAPNSASVGRPGEAKTTDTPGFSLEEPAAFDQRSTEAAPPKGQIILLVVLKFILLVPVLIALLYRFESEVPALFSGMLLGLVIVCLALYVSRRRKPRTKG